MIGTATTPIGIRDRVVVFDYGEVISLEPSTAEREHLLTLAGIRPERADAFWEAYWAPRAELDRGTLPIHDYWRAVGAALGEEWDRALTHQLWVADLTSWLSISPETAAVLDDLAAGGTRLALLSNAGPDYSSFFRSGSLADVFEQVFVIGELKLVKPDAAIYRHVLEALDIAPEQMVFIDNRAENIEAAERIGITGHVFTSAEGLRAFLGTLAR